MIHSARPIVTPVANNVFCNFVFLDLKSGDGRTYGRKTCAKTMIPTCRDFGLAERINIKKGVINDPLGQTHSHTSSKHFFVLQILFF